MTQTAKVATLVYLLRQGAGGAEVVLALKTRKVAVGRRFGYGGKVETGQTLRQSAQAELFAEGNILFRQEDLEPAGLLITESLTADGELQSFVVYIYVLRQWSIESQAPILQGTPKASEEMADPQWFRVEALPHSEMLTSDITWLGRLLSGEKLYIYAQYSPSGETLYTDVFPWGIG